MEIRYYGDKITHHIAKTPEGFLICQDVPISRTGYQTYLSSEMFDSPSNGHRAIPVYRPAEEVFDVKSLASFEGKPVTNEHPDEDVKPENYSRYACGHVQNVHVGTGADSNKVLADLYITDPHLIHLIQHGKREISCGYYAEERRDAAGRICQTRIRGNHVAVVKNGRAGKNVCIRDKKPDALCRRKDYGVKGMKKGVHKAKEAISNAVGGAKNKIVGVANKIGEKRKAFRAKLAKNKVGRLALAYGAASMAPTTIMHHLTKEGIKHGINTAKGLGGAAKSIAHGRVKSGLKKAGKTALRSVTSIPGEVIGHHVKEGMKMAFGGYGRKKNKGDSLRCDYGVKGMKKGVHKAKEIISNAAHKAGAVAGAAARVAGRVGRAGLAGAGAGLKSAAHSRPARAWLGGVKKVVGTPAKAGLAVAKSVAKNALRGAKPIAKGALKGAKAAVKLAKNSVERQPAYKVAMFAKKHIGNELANSSAARAAKREFAKGDSLGRISAHDSAMYYNLLGGNRMRKRRYLYDEEPFIDDDVLLDEDILEDDDYLVDEDEFVDACGHADDDYLEDEDEFVDACKDDDYLEDEDGFEDDDYLEDEDEFEDDDYMEDDDEEFVDSDEFEDDDEEFVDSDEFEDDDEEFVDSDDFEDDDEELLADDDEEFVDSDEFEDDDVEVDEVGAAIQDACRDARRTFKLTRKQLKDSMRTLRALKKHYKDAIILNDDDLEDDDEGLIQTDADLCDDDYLADDDELLSDDDELLSDDDEEILSDSDEFEDDDELLSDDDDVEIEENTESEILDEDKTRALREITEASRGISNPNERKNLQDAIYNALCGRNQMKDVMRITKKNVKNRMDSANANKNKVNVADQQSIYDSFNPHKKTSF